MGFDAQDKSHKKPAAEHSHESTAGSLHQESAELMSSRPTKRMQKMVPLGLDEEGQYKVLSGNSLSSIAMRSLAMRGKSPNDWSAVENEMDRIVDLNSDKYPSLKTNRAFIREGWNLKIHDKELGADATCEWKQWKEAPPNQWTIVGKCERVLANDQSWVVVQPGGEAVLNPGSKAFAAPDSRIKMALPGSYVIAAGGETHDYGSTIQTVNAKAKIIQEDLNSLVKKPSNPVI